MIPLSLGITGLILTPLVNCCSYAKDGEKVDDIIDWAMKLEGPRDFENTMHDIYKRAKSEAGYTASEFLNMVAWELQSS